MLILEDELFVELASTMIEAFCLPCAALVPLAHSGTEKSQNH